MAFRRWRGFGGSSKQQQQQRQQLRQRNDRQRRSYVARQYEHLLFEPLEWRQLLTVTLAPISGPDGGIFDIQSGKALYVPLTGADAGHTVSYTANSSNSNIKLTVIDGNPTLKLDVHGTRSNGVDFTGTLYIELFDNLAPETVSKISALVKSGVYDGEDFYRIVPTFVIQGGLQGTPNEPPFADEFNALLSFNSPGILAMANPGTADSNTSEFFITAIDQPQSNQPHYLSYRHSIFGQLTGGFDIYQDIMNAKGITSSNSSPSPRVIIDHASIIDGGDQSAVLQVIVPNDFTGTSDITVTAHSSDGTTATRDFNIDAAPATTPGGPLPIILAPVTDKSTTAGTPISFQISAAIASGYTLQPFTVTGTDGFRSPAQNVTVQITPGDNHTATVTLTPAAGFSGTIDLVLHADDNTNDVHDAMSFSLEVLPPEITLHTDPVNIANGTTASLSGKGSPGATISVVITDGTHSTDAQTTTVAEDGTWAINGVNVIDLDDGTITYMATDTTHNVPAANVTATKDLVAPPVAIGSIGFINNTNKSSFAVSGTSQAGSTIHLVISDGVHDGVIPADVLVAADGTWTITGIDLSGLNEGTLTFTATATDAADNLSSPDSKTATKDTVAPAVDITTATTPVTIANVTITSVNGTAEAGATITLVVTDGTHSTTAVMVVATGGTWTFDNVDLSELNDGAITYQITATDEAGNTASDTFAATKAVLAVTVYTNPINISNVGSASISGTGEAGASISVEISDGENAPIVRTTSVDSEGNWSISSIDLSQLNDGQINYKITATNSAEDSVVLNRTATKDTVAPSVTLDPITAPINNAGKGNVSVSGTVTGLGGQPGTVKVVVNDADDTTAAVVKMVTVNADGTWTITGIDVSSLADGTLTFVVTATDNAENVSAVDSETAVKDTAAPTVTVTTVSNPVTPANQTSVTISGSVTGTGSQATTVSVVVTDANNHSLPAKTVTVNADGTWSISGIDVSSLDDGALTFKVTATDLAGNASAQVTKSAQKSTSDNSISGYVYVDVNQSNKFDSGDIRLKGVYVTLTGVDPDGNALPSQVVKTDSKGFYRFDGLAPGTYTVREAQPSGFVNKVTNVGSLGGVKHTDVVSQIVVTGGQIGTKYNFGEKGLSSTHVSVNDFLASTPPAKTRYNNAIANGSTVSPIVTSIVKLDADPTEAGTARFRVTFNKTVNGVDAADFRVLATGTIAGTSIASVSGSGKTYTVTVNTGTGNGKIGLALRDNDSIKDTKKQKSLGGNGSGNGDFISSSYTVSKAPAVAINSNNSPINNANKGNVTISGTGEVGATISLVGSDGTHSTSAKTAVVGSNGTWTITGIDASGLNDGNITFTATASNGSGKTSTATRTIVKDIVAPAVAITTVTDPVNNGNQATTSASGTGEVGSTVSIVATDGAHSTTAKTAVVGSDGKWSITVIDVTSLSDGTITYNVTATDTAGNTAQASKTATKDVVAPAAAVINPPGVVNNSNKSNFTVTGTGVAGSTIHLTINNGADVANPPAVTVQGDNTWSVTGIDVSAIADGTLTYTVFQTDAAGNASNVATLTGLKDTVAPAVTLNNPAAINSANQSSLSVSGTAEAGAVITLVVGDGTPPNVTPPTTTADAGGAWSITGIDVSSLAEGTITFSVFATDAAGNISAAVTKDANKDTAAPEVAVTSVTDPISMANQHSTSASGTGEVGATISVVASDGVTSTAPMTATVNEAGTWTIIGIDVSGLADGTITFTATATDAAGNSAEAALTATKSVIAITSVTDPINAANQTTVSIAGTSDANATIAVVVSGGVNPDVMPPSVTAGSDGAWSITGIDVTSLADGTITFTVTATDVDSNTATKTVTAAKDTIAPLVAITSSTSQINAASAANVAIGGTGEVGAAINVTISNGVDPAIVLPPVTVDGDGNWSIAGIDVSSLADGVITYSVTATDSAGNVSAPEMATANKDVAPPALAIGTVTDPIGLANQHATTIEGTGEAGTTVKVTATDGVSSTSEHSVTVAGNGTWSIAGIDVSSLADGTITYNVTATDAFDNSTQSSLTATKSTVVITSVTNPINAANQANASIVGTGEIDASITVVISDGVNPDITLPAVIVDSSGNWSISGIDVSSLAEGTLTFSVTATDIDSNAATVTKTASKDTLAPAVSIDSITNPVNAANAAGTAASGTGEAGAAIVLTVTDGVVTTSEYHAVVAEDGTWSITGIDVSALADGTITYSVTATDAAGNISEISTANAEKDVIAPAVTLDNITATINSANVQTTLANGTGEEGAAITVTATDGVNSVTAPATVVSGGVWSIANFDVSDLVDGTITYTVTATDAAGNTAQASLTATKDTVAPAVAITSVSDPVNSGNATAVNVQGTGEAGNSIVLIISDGSTVLPLPTTVAGDGTWSFADVDVSAFLDGTLTFTVTASDSAGNMSSDSAAVTKDVLGPTVTSITLADADPTSAQTVHFTVVFSEAVTGVGASSFITVPGGDVSGVTIDDVSASGSGDTYTVTVSFTSGTGSLGLNVDDVDLIFDMANNPLGGLGDHNGDFTGDFYTIA